MDKIQIDGVVTRYPYRTATVMDVVVTLPRGNDDPLELALATAAGARIDNHTAYKVEKGEGKPPVYFMFTDFTIQIGTSILEAQW